MELIFSKFENAFLKFQKYMFFVLMHKKMICFSMQLQCFIKEYIVFGAKITFLFVQVTNESIII